MPGVSNKWSHTITYILTVWILWECVKPVTVLTILHSETVLFLFIVITMLFFYFRLPGWVSLISGIALTAFCIHYFFFSDEPLFGGTWLFAAGGDIYRNMRLIWEGGLLLLSDQFSACLFFVMLWLICLAVKHWLASGHVFLIFFLAVAVLSVIDTFTFYNAARSLIIVTVLGLMVLAVRKYTEISRQNKRMRSGTTSYLAWAGVSGLFLLIVLGLGIFGPKADAQWPSPLKGLQNLGIVGANQGGTFFSTGQRIGYDADDSRLGGSLGMDNTVLFTARVTGSGNYWRVASKDTYTGKGWENNKSYFIPYDSKRRMTAFSFYEGQTKVAQQSAYITFSQASPSILPYAGQPNEVRVPGRQLKLDPISGQVFTSNERAAREEHLEYAEPTYQISKLRQVRDGGDPQTVLETDLQLPGSLPGRVRSLANRLTEKQNNRYDKALAIVDYLKSSRFTYSTDEIPRLARNQDYVDQFLFESRIGYCDNFSTAMVVLLRSVGIPARWVKGFSTGEYDGQEQVTFKGKKTLASIYQVSNANAHSWVEVYFPGNGWVTFEPTPSFSDPNQFIDSAVSGSASSRSSEKESGGSTGTQSVQNQTPQQSRDQQSQQPNAQQDDPKQQSQSDTRKQDGTGNGMIVFAIIAAALLPAAAVLLFLTRRNWLAAYYIRKQRRMTVRDRKTFAGAFHNLSRLLGLKGFHRSQTQTIHEFSQIVDRALAGRDMQKLAGHYERLAYSWHEKLSKEERIRIDNLFKRMTEKMAELKK